MILKLRNYPLNPKLTIQNNMLVLGDIFLYFIVCAILMVLMGAPGLEKDIVVYAIVFIPPIILFVIVHRIINNHTDEKYKIDVAKYKELTSKLLNQDPNLVKDRLLKYPANITLKRVADREGKFAKQKYIVNGQEYSLKNNETITFTTNRALNFIDAKSLGSPTSHYFTVKDNENLVIEYRLAFLKNVERLEK